MKGCTKLRATGVIALIILAAVGCRQRTSTCPVAARLREILGRSPDGQVLCGARVVDLSTGQVLYASCDEQTLIPASTLKLLLTAAALDRFGPGHTFKTYLAMDGEDLWLIGTGDPGTADPRIASWSGQKHLAILDNWLAALKARGIGRINGQLYYYDGALDQQWVHPSWSRSFLTDWYAAPVSGLNFNDNCLDISIVPTDPGQLVEYDILPPARIVAVLNRCATGPEHAPRIERHHAQNIFVLNGTCSRPERLDSKPVTDPGAFFADVLRTCLESHGIAICGQTRRATRPLLGTIIPPADRLIATHETRITDVLARINRNSQNLFAEALCKMLGRQHEADCGRTVPGSWHAGIQAIGAFLQRQGIATGKLVMVDGSGLSRDNRLTARLLTDLLCQMHRHQLGQVFRESLAVAGQEGSLQDRMIDLTGRVRAKTGHVAGVSGLAGYIQTRSGRWLAFAFLYNGFSGSDSPFRQMQDEACRILADFP